MERILSVKQMRSADDFTINKLGIAEEVLVERAGKCVADEIIRRFPGGRVLVCIGRVITAQTVLLLLEPRHLPVEQHLASVTFHI